jgi:hypothetical protein
MLLVIPAGMPESSHKDVKFWTYSYAKSSSCEVPKLPSMAVDYGIHAGMTANFVIMKIAGLRLLLF